MESQSAETMKNAVNAWIYLDEDEPSGAGYNSLNSSYQSLISNNVYQNIDMLFVCFFDTVSDNKGYYTLEIGNASTIHPGGLTTKQYLQSVISDSRNQNPSIKILATLNYNETTLSRIFSNDPNQWVTEANIFASNLSTYLVANQLNGFDVDWEGKFSQSITKKQFNLLFTAIRNAFNKSLSYLYLTLSPADTGNMDADTVNSCFDFLNVQLYSGFTSVDDFLNEGILPSKIGYGAQFEKGVGIWQNADQVYSALLDGFMYNQQKYQYSVVTQWRLNSDNYSYEQSQQLLLSQFVHDIQIMNFDDTLLIARAGNPPITSIKIGSGNVLDSLQPTNSASSAIKFNLLQHGGNGGSSSIISIESGDTITQVSGFKGNWFGWNCIVQITITTKNGKKYGPFGSMENVTSVTPFSLIAPSGQSIVAFSGSTIRVPESNGKISYVVANLSVSYSN